MDDKLTELAKIIGTNKKCGYKVGDMVPDFKGAINKSKIIRIEKDLLGNEIYFTKFNLYEHIKPEIKKIFPDYESKIIDIIKNPDVIFEDTKHNYESFMYSKIYNGKNLLLFANIGKNSQKFFTLICRDKMLDKNGKRYKLIYEG